MVSRAILNGWPLVAPSKKDYGKNVIDIAKGVTVALIADSTGTGVGSDGVGTGQVERGWFHQLGRLLRARGAHVSNQNRFGCASGSWATLLTMDARVTSTGAWSQTGSLAPGGNSFGASAAGSASFALGRSTKLAIYWVNNTAGRVFTYSVDGSDPVEVTTTGVYEIRKTVISVPRGHHTLTLAQKTAACNILGVEAYDDTDGMPIRLLNFAISGATSTQLADNTDVNAGRRAGYAYHAPDVTFIEGGLINDAVQAISAATTKANLLAMAAAVRVNKPAGKVIFVTPNPIGETPTIRAALEAGVQVMKEANAEVGNGLIDMYGIEGNYENENRLGRMSDPRHPNTPGYAFIAAKADLGINLI